MQAVKACLNRIKEFFAQQGKNLSHLTSAYLANFGAEFDEAEKLGTGEAIQIEDSEVAPAKLDDLKAGVHDLLEEINLGTPKEPQPTYISQLLKVEYREKLVNLICEFKDWFAWEYIQMPRLNPKLVEHKFQSYQILNRISVAWKNGSRSYSEGKK